MMKFLLNSQVIFLITWSQAFSATRLLNYSNRSEHQTIQKIFYYCVDKSSPTWQDFSIILFYETFERLIFKVRNQLAAVGKPAAFTDPVQIGPVFFLGRQVGFRDINHHWSHAQIKLFPHCVWWNVEYIFYIKDLEIW